MHGLCNRALYSFLHDTVGAGPLSRHMAAAGLSAQAFEGLFACPDATSWALLAVVAADAGQDPEALLEDLGTWLVSAPSCAAIRRLLRFGGPDFVSFLHALEDLPDRARLAVPDLDLPPLTVQGGDGAFRLSVGPGLPGFAAVATGLIRAMADDYGTLVVLSRHGGTVEIGLIVAQYAEGRSFALAG